MSEYTPGPWKARDSGDGYGTVQVFSGEKEIADCSGGWQELGKEQCNANAILCAAATDLLQALKDIVEIERRDNLADPACVATDEWRQEAWDAARAAIAKATGEEICKRK